MNTKNKCTDTTPSPPEGVDVATLRIPRKLGETAVLLLLGGLALVLLFQSRSMIAHGDDVVGPGTFPGIVAALLVGASALAIVKVLRSAKPPPVVIKRPGALALAAALLISFPVLLEPLGYYALAIPWVFAFSWAARVRAPFLLGINLVTSFIVARFVFEALLGTPLP